MVRIFDLNIESRNGERSPVLHPVLVCGDDGLVLVDAGYPGQAERFAEAARRNGADLRDLRAIVITHHDYDHIGSLRALKTMFPDAAVVSSAIEKDYISGSKRSLRLEQAERLFESLPEAERAGALAFQKTLESVESTPVDVAVADGDLLPYCGGLRIVATPGHMPGHISVFVGREKALISGDALAAENGVLLMANPQYTLDMDAARRSVAKLARMDIDRIYCYHGGLVEGNIRAALMSMLSVDRYRI